MVADARKNMADIHLPTFPEDADTLVLCDQFDVNLALRIVRHAHVEVAVATVELVAQRHARLRTQTKRTLERDHSTDDSFGLAGRTSGKRLLKRSSFWVARRTARAFSSAFHLSMRPAGDL